MKLHRLWTGVIASAIAGVWLVLALPAAGQEPEAWSASEVVALENGFWFDGEQFRARQAVYIIAGRLETSRPRRIDRRVDLAGGYVISPFGDAHTHHYDSPFQFPTQRGADLRAGVFYAMTMTAPALSVARIRAQFAGPDNVDVRTSLGGITGPESHPAEIYEALALGYYTFEQQLAHQAEIRASRSENGNAYHVVSNRDELDAAWDRLSGQRPDFVKVYLRSSERYAEGWGRWGPGGGLDPALLPAVAEHARGAGLRLAVAVSSVSDYRAALAAGASLATHLPCYQDTEIDGADNPYFDAPADAECQLLRADSRAAARQRMVSILITSEWAKPSALRGQRYLDWEGRNVALLEAAGAPLAIGSNAYGDTVIAGLIEQGQRRLFGVARLLRLATMDTPRAIFPERRVGCLRSGCEASFLVLEANPLLGMAAIRDIRWRVKDGVLLSAEAIAPPSE